MKQERQRVSAKSILEKIINDENVRITKYKGQYIVHVDYDGQFYPFASLSRAEFKYVKKLRKDIDVIDADDY